MWKRLKEKLNIQHGSATIEAVVGFTGFILVIFTILSLVNLCRAQMLISSAMDNAAKELSQYAYFYKMSGLQKFSESLGEAASVGKEDINGVIGSVDSLYSSMTEAINGTKESYTNISEATKEGTLQWSDIETAYNGIQEKGENINASVDGVMNQFEAIGDNPMAYMKSLVAIAGSKGLDLMKSHMIAAPLAKMFVRQQFGGKALADQTLKGLGVKDGLEGMNFKMSSMFTTQDPEAIHLVVFYELELIQLFDMEVLSIKLCKQSRCGAWLGGDNVQDFVDPTKPTTAATPSGGQSSNTGESSPESTNNTDPGSTEPSGSNPDGTNETQPSTPPAESTEPTSPTVDTTDSIWHKADEFYEGSTKDIEFDDMFFDSGVKLNDKHGNFYYGENSEGKPTNVAYTVEHATDADDIDFYYGEMFKGLKTDMKYNEERAYADGEVTQIVLVLYVPENISQEEIDKIKAKAQEAEREFLDNYSLVMNMGSEDAKKHMEETYAIAGVTIDIRPAGGNYDPSQAGG